MALERIYTIPLRKEFSRAPNYKRTKRSVRTIREFLQKHMKCDNVKLGKYLNLELWKNGRKNPPPRIQVKAIKDKIKIKDVLEKEEKRETKLQKEEESKPEDILKHQKVSSKEAQEKMRSQKIISSPQKPRHEKHDAKGKK